MKPVLMIHEIREEMFDLPLENYILTFDDGLYGHYCYYPKFAKISTEKIYFISSGIICKGQQNLLFPSSKEAHEKAFNGNFEDFMTVEQIQELMKDPLVSIGAHGHSHKDLDLFDKLFDKVRHIQSDTDQMIEWFEKTLSFKPTKFCYPYNNDLDQLYPTLLKKKGFTEFYGRSRIPIESLLK